MKRIVIIPSFASSHFLKCWIPNMIQTSNPDIIIINEGLFPQGPENRGHVDTEEFKKKYTYDNSAAGFDWKETIDLITGKFHGDHPLILCGIIEYDTDNANQCFIDAVSTFPVNEHWSTIPEPGDLIFPLEPDAFIFEGDMGIINEEISKLKPGEGLSCKWVDFLETQFYTESINLQNPKYRRFCYCFDNMENYKEAMNGFMSQYYPKLKKTDSFFIRHYPWFVYDEWKELRYALIHRTDPQYWKYFELGLKTIRQFSQNVRAKSHDKILIRPSRQDEGRWARFIDIEHPEAIKNHPNFVK